LLEWRFGGSCAWDERVGCCDRRSGPFVACSPARGAHRSRCHPLFGPRRFDQDAVRDRLRAHGWRPAQSLGVEGEGRLAHRAAPPHPTVRLGRGRRSKLASPSTSHPGQVGGFPVASFVASQLSDSAPEVLRENPPALPALLASKSREPRLVRCVRARTRRARCERSRTRCEAEHLAHRRKSSSWCHRRWCPTLPVQYRTPESSKNMRDQATAVNLYQSLSSGTFGRCCAYRNGDGSTGAQPSTAMRRGRDRWQSVAVDWQHPVLRLFGGPQRAVSRARTVTNLRTAARASGRRSVLGT
jgi:hypothetical protein